MIRLPSAQQEQTSPEIVREWLATSIAISESLFGDSSMDWSHSSSESDSELLYCATKSTDRIAAHIGPYSREIARELVEIDARIPTIVDRTVISHECGDPVVPSAALARWVNHPQSLPCAHRINLSALEIYDERYAWPSNQANQASS